jgi:hypothetical protein
MGRNALVWAIAIVSIAMVAAWGEEPKAPPVAAAMDDAAKERFLLEGQIVRTATAPGGVTLSTRATLSLGGFEHDAHIQTIDEQKPLATMIGGAEIDFRDSYRNNVAAYRLDRALGLGMVPVTALRSYGGKPAAFTWWVDDVRMSEKDRLKKKIHPPDVGLWNCQIFVVRLFDQLIYNFDRNLGNLLIDGEWRIWMIDHTRAFKIFKGVKSEKALGTRCERHLLAALRRLDLGAIKGSMHDLLSEAQVAALLARRDQIVAYYDARIAELGEGAVLYDLEPRAGTEPPSR